MHDLLSPKHCICDHIDMIDAIMVQCALEDTRGELLSHCNQPGWLV